MRQLLLNLSDYRLLQILYEEVLDLKRSDGLIALGSDRCDDRVAFLRDVDRRLDGLLRLRGGEAVAPVVWPLGVHVDRAGVRIRGEKRAEREEEEFFHESSVVGCVRGNATDSTMPDRPPQAALVRDPDDVREAGAVVAGGAGGVLGVGPGEDVRAVALDAEGDGRPIVVQAAARGDVLVVHREEDDVAPLLARRPPAEGERAGAFDRRRPHGPAAVADRAALEAGSAVEFRCEP